jgi:hypothetical protein
MLPYEATMGRHTAADMVVGVDPGGRATGVVARTGNDVAAAAVVTRCGDGVMPDAAYLNEVLDTVHDYAEGLGATVVAVEGVNEPSWYLNGKVSPANVGGLMATCVVLGAVMAVFPAAVVVAPNRHGAAPLGAYPPALRPATGKGKGHDRLRHARSAFDVAHGARNAIAFRELTCA